MIKLLQRIPPSLLALLLVAIPLLVHIGMKWFDLPPPYGTVIGQEDPDPWLRLTLVREWLTGGGWYNHIVTHSGAPSTVITSPWTRPLDLVLAFLTEIQPHSVDLSIRLVRAALLNPLVWTMLLLLGLFRNVRLFTNSALVPFLCVGLVESSVGMLNYFGEANSDHHSMLATLFVWAFYGVLYPTPSRRLIIVSGLLLALQLWVSPEAMVLILGIYGWYGILWLLDDRVHAAPLPLLSLTIALARAAAVMIERPPALWLTPIYDTISVVYVYVLACSAAGVFILYRLRPATHIERLLLALVIMLMVLGALWLAYPLAFKGPLAEVDPYITQTFMRSINEAEPLGRESVFFVLAILFQPIAAVLLLIIAWQYRPSIIAPRHVGQLLYFLVVTGLLFLTQVRFYYYFYPFVVLVFAPLAIGLLNPESPAAKPLWPARWLVRFPEDKQALRRIPLILALIGLPFVFILLEPDKDTFLSKKADACSEMTYQLIQGGALNRLDGDRPLTLFSPTNFGGQLLFWTPNYIIASNYHREGKGIQYIWEATNITNAEALRHYLAARNVDALLICPDAQPVAGSVLDKLQTGSLSLPWLKPVPYAIPPRKPKDPDTPPVTGANPVIFLVKYNHKG
jgi:hypothetical protein